MSARNPKPVQLIALGANTVMAAALFAGHAATGSSALMAAAIHALVVAALVGSMVLGTSPRVAKHHRERDFWSAVAPVMPLSIGAGYALFSGLAGLRDGPVPDRPDIAYAALGLAGTFAVLGLWSIFAAIDAHGVRSRRLAHVRAADEGVLVALLLNGYAVLASIGIAGLATLAAARLARPEFDAVATIVIGLVMTCAAALFTIETRSLLTQRFGDPPPRASTPPVPASSGDGSAALPGQAVDAADGTALPDSDAHASRKARKRRRHHGR